MSSGSESSSSNDSEVTVGSLRGQISNLIANLNADIPDGIPVYNHGYNISNAIGVPAPRNYEFSHLRKLSTADLFKLDNALANILVTQSGMQAAHTRVCRNRIGDILNEKI